MYWFLLTGELSWKNPKSDSSQEQVAHSVVCTVSSQLNETNEPIVRSDNWPNKLIMQLIPKSLVSQIGGTPSKYFQNARSVLFHFTDNPAKESLTKVFIQGYAGCVHFHVSLLSCLTLINSWDFIDCILLVARNFLENWEKF